MNKEELEKQAEESLIILTTTKKAIELQDGIYLRLEEVKRLLFDNYIRGSEEGTRKLHGEISNILDEHEKMNDYAISTETVRVIIDLFIENINSNDNSENKKSSRKT